MLYEALAADPSVVVPLSEDAVTRLLGRNDFVAGWLWSYNYRNEILNRRRIVVELLDRHWIEYNWLDPSTA